MKYGANGHCPCAAWKGRSPMITYQELLTQALAELNDREQRSIPQGFSEQLMEMCLLIISLGHQPLRSNTEIVFPSAVVLNIFDFLPLVDIYVQTNLPNIITPIMIRNDEGRQLDISSIEVLMYILDSLIDTETEQQEYYRIYDNLLGIRPAPQSDILLELIYLPYIEVSTLNQSFALDDSYIPHMLNLLKCFLNLRNGATAQSAEEWKLYVNQR